MKLPRSSVPFPIRTSERIIELTEDGSEVVERNAVSGQLTRLRSLDITISAADSAVESRSSRSSSVALRVAKISHAILACNTMGS